MAIMTKKRKSEIHSPTVAGQNKKARYDERGQESTVAVSPQPVSQNGSPRGLPPLPPISAAMSKAVFTNQSVVPHGQYSNPFASYERLELLGDAYVEVMATRLIWEKFKELPAGRLSQIRELLVKNETLGIIATQYGLDRQISAAPHVRNSPKQWAKVKGDVIEAYVAAVVLADDKMGGAGFIAAEKWLHELWVPKLQTMSEEKAPNSNAKNELSRKVVARGVKLEYIEERPMKQLKGGQQTYFLGVYLTGWEHAKQLLGSGQGLSKTVAGNLAAEDALQNPLVETIAEKKRELDEMRKGTNHNRDLCDAKVDQNPAKDRMTRERELVEKKRSMFMSTELR
jgi:ribonuclease III